MVPAGERRTQTEKNAMKKKYVEEDKKGKEIFQNVSVNMGPASSKYLTEDKSSIPAHVNARYCYIVRYLREHKTCFPKISCRLRERTVRLMHNIS